MALVASSAVVPKVGVRTSRGVAITELGGLQNLKNKKIKIEENAM